MSDTGASVGPGWYHAEGDPPGTQRYWDGAAWQGEPRPVPAPPPPAPQMPPPPPPPAPAPPPPGPPRPAMVGPSTGYGQPSDYGEMGSFGHQEAPRKKSRWKLVVGLVVGFMLLIGGCTLLLWRAVSGPIDAGNDFLAELQDADYGGAFALTDPDCFDGAGPGLLREVFGSAPIESYRLSTTSVDSTNGRTSGTTSGSITFAGGDDRTIELFLIDEGGWLVCGFDLGPPGSG